MLINQVVMSKNKKQRVDAILNKEHIKPSSLSYRSSNGFSLLEVLVVMTLIALIISVALPSYQHLSQQKLRHAMINQLMAATVILEQHYRVHYDYPKTLPSALMDVDSAFQLTYVKSDKSYLIEAQLYQNKGSSCHKMRLTNQGLRQAFNAQMLDTSTQCWQ